MGKGMDGHAGKDLIIKVPCGTLVWQLKDTTAQALIGKPQDRTRPAKTLIEGFGRMWRDGERDLLAAFTEAAGLPEPVDLAQRLAAAWTGQDAAPGPGEAGPGPGELVIGLESVRLRLAVAQIATTLQHLTTVNQLRQSLGITTSQCEAETLAECDAAFDLLENGLSDVAARPAG